MRVGTRYIFRFFPARGKYELSNKKSQSRSLNNNCYWCNKDPSGEQEFLKKNYKHQFSNKCTDATFFKYVFVFSFLDVHLCNGFVD